MPEPMFFSSLIHTQTRTHSHHARHATAVAGFSLGNTGVFTQSGLGENLVWRGAERKLRFQITPSRSAVEGRQSCGQAREAQCWRVSGLKSGIRIRSRRPRGAAASSRGAGAAAGAGVGDQELSTSAAVVVERSKLSTFHSPSTR